MSSKSSSRQRAAAGTLLPGAAVKQVMRRLSPGVPRSWISKRSLTGSITLAPRASAAGLSRRFKAFCFSFAPEP